MMFNSNSDRMASVAQLSAAVARLDVDDADDGFALGDIKSESSTRRSQTLFATQDDRFAKFRNFFKNHDTALAREIQAKCSKSRAELLQWICDHVGAIVNDDQLQKSDLGDIALVSAAITKYGELALDAIYARGEMHALSNMALHTHALRRTSQQQACRDSSKASDKHKKQAAHYVGLEVMLKLNERLPVDHRLGDELKIILNLPGNLRLVKTETNQSFHKEVDALLVALPETLADRQLSKKEYDRLVQIAKVAQSEEFQNAMILAKGHQLYLSLRDAFGALDRISKQPKLWNARKDKRELQRTSRSTNAEPTPQASSSESSNAADRSSSSGKPPRTAKEAEPRQRKREKKPKPSDGSADKPSRQSKESTGAIRLKKDGTPDLRYRAAAEAEAGGVERTRRRRSNQSETSAPKPARARGKKDDPGRRQREVPEPAAATRLKKDGTPDLRRQENRDSLSSSSSWSYSDGDYSPHSSDEDSDDDDLGSLEASSDED